MRQICASIAFTPRLPLAGGRRKSVLHGESTDADCSSLLHVFRERRPRCIACYEKQASLLQSR